MRIYSKVTTMVGIFATAATLGLVVSCAGQEDIAGPAPIVDVQLVGSVPQSCLDALVAAETVFGLVADVLFETADYAQAGFDLDYQRIDEITAFVESQTPIIASVGANFNLLAAECRNTS